MVFGRQDLKKHGVRADAIVRAADVTGSTNSHGSHKWKLDLEVTYEDGSTGEASCTAWAFDIAAGFGPSEMRARGGTPPGALIGAPGG